MAEEFLDGLSNIFNEDIGDITADTLENPFQEGYINDSIKNSLGDGLSFGNNKITDIKIGADEFGNPTITFNGDGDPVSLDEFKKNLYGEGPTIDTEGTFREGVEPNLEASFKVMFGDKFDIDTTDFKNLQETVSDDWKTTNEPTRNVTSENARATDTTRAREEKLADDLKNAKTPEERAQLTKDYLKENFGDSLDEETIDNAEEEANKKDGKTTGKEGNFLKVLKGVGIATLIGTAGIGLYGVLKAHQQALNGCWVTTRDGSRYKIMDLTCNEYAREKLAVRGQSIYNSSNGRTVAFAPVCNKSSGCDPTKTFQFNLCPMVLPFGQEANKAGTSVSAQICNKDISCNNLATCTGGLCDKFSGCPPGTDNYAYPLNAKMSGVKCNNCYVLTNNATSQQVDGTNLLTCVNDKSAGKWCSNNLCNSQYVRLPAGASITCVSVSLAAAASDWFKTALPDISNWLKKILMIVLYVVLGIIGVALLIGLIRFIVKKAMGN